MAGRSHPELPPLPAPPMHPDMAEDVAQAWWAEGLEDWIQSELGCGYADCTYWTCRMAVRHGG